MVGVKKVVVEEFLALERARELLKDYKCIKIVMPGTKIHKRLGLGKGQALVSAWSRRKEGKR